MIRRIGHVTTDFRPPVGGAEVSVSDLIEALRPIAEEQIVFQFDNSDLDASLRDDPSLVLIPRLPGRWRHRRGPNLYAFNWGLRRKAVRARLAECDLLTVTYPFHWPAVAWHPRAIAISQVVEWDQPPARWTHRRRKRIAERCHREAKGLVANDTNFFREMGMDVPPKSKLWEAVAPRRWCLPNCVDTERFSPSVEPRVPERLRLRLQRPSGPLRPFILVARNASPHRGIHLAIEALGRIADRHADLALVIVGQRAKPDYQLRLDQTAGEFGIKDRVIHFGHVAREEMPGLHRAATVGMVPTIAHEGTSYSASESMACGTATISSDHGGLADLPTVQAKANGEALAKALERVLPQAEEIGAKQRAVVEEKFNLRRWGEAWRQVAQEMME
ncbi:glycosyltransferase family 4 protein [Candidatus Sumerlaeota bacterium]|nr:glycosyltransferase family 4 protein [Candidatus Sumerlaeota bacterium]